MTQKGASKQRKQLGLYKRLCVDGRLENHCQAVFRVHLKFDLACENVRRLTAPWKAFRAVSLSNTYGQRMEVGSPSSDIDGYRNWVLP